MSEFSDFIDGVVDEGKILAKDELKKLVADAKEDDSDFVRLQASNLERWTVMLMEGDLTSKGYKKLVKKMEVLAELDSIRLQVSAKASAQRLADGVQDMVVDKLFKLI